MFAYLTPKEQVRKLQQENRALKEHVKVLEDALVELAEIITEEEHDGLYLLPPNHIRRNDTRRSPCQMA